MRILLVDDHQLFVQGLKFLLTELDERLECVTAPSLEAAAQQTGPFKLVLLDLRMPGNSGTAGLARMRQAFEGIPVVIVSGEDNPQVIHQLISDGAAGFIPKSSSPNLLVAALKLVLNGGIYLPPQAFTGAALAANTGPSVEELGLTVRQTEVLLKVVQGKTNKTIARELALSEATVKQHVASAFRVLGVSNRIEALYKAARLGLTQEQLV
jgi:DNA-binding NarL/FixJ family response regulator